jgi:Protein ChrB, N-terminal
MLALIGAGVDEGGEVRSWVLLLYKVPSEPSARRVYVWRKLKRLGALLLHDAVWVLPATPFTVEQFQWLASEIREMGGSAMVWESRLLAADEQDEALVAQFTAQVDTVYSAILADLEREDADAAELSRRFQQAQTQDYFHSALGARVRERLLAWREMRGGE